MRFYKNLFDAVIEGLYSIHTQNGYAGQVVTQLLKSNKKWGSKDRRFIAETVYDITRYKRLFFYLAEIDGQPEKQDYWKVVGAWVVTKDEVLPNWDEFEGIKPELIKERFEEAKNNFVIWESIPDWLNEIGEKALGDIWQKEIKALNEEAEVVLRVNSLAVPKEQKNNEVVYVQESLNKENIATELVANQPKAIQLQERKNVLHTKAYSKGWVEVQDANSQKVAEYANVEPGMNVIDACAGAGGKSLHLASLMKNKGKIIAFDVIDWKLTELIKRANKARVDMVTTTAPTMEALNKYVGFADVVLVDAPCTGLGTLKRKAGLKWKLNEEFLNEMVATQKTILANYAPMTKPGGTLVYATCSILPQENQNQIKDFLATDIGKQFELEADQQLYAHTTGYDGFYMARLKRTIS